MHAMVVSSSRDKPGVSCDVDKSCTKVIKVFLKFPVTDTNTELLGIPSNYAHLKLKLNLFIKIFIVI